MKATPPNPFRPTNQRAHDRIGGPYADEVAQINRDATRTRFPVELVPVLFLVIGLVIDATKGKRTR